MTLDTYEMTDFEKATKRLADKMLQFGMTQEALKEYRNLYESVNKVGSLLTRKNARTQPS